MDRLGFVIVQYNNSEDTFQCIQSIKEAMFGHDYQIMLIDNDSPNKAFEITLDYYQGDKAIKVLKTSENLGYAKGINFGVNQLLSYYDADLICVLNNDVLFNKEDLFSEINKIQIPFDLLAPKILCLDGKLQNPQREVQYSLIWINVYLLVYQFLFFLYRIRLDFIPYFLAVFTIGKVYSSHKKSHSDLSYISKLHGSCMFFSRNYVEYYNRQPMLPETFLFLEEDFLSLRCAREQKKILYLDTIHVMHLEDHSINSIFKSTRLKRGFVYKNHIQSFKSFKNYYLSKN